MAESAVAVAYRAIRQRLVATSELWSSNVFPDLAPANVNRPFVVFFHMAGGEINVRRIQDASLVIVVKVISGALAEALQGAGRISALLNDADFASDPLDAGSEWVIQNVNQEQAVHLVEMVGGEQLYHSGHKFRFRLERISG